MRPRACPPCAPSIEGVSDLYLQCVIVMVLSRVGGIRVGVVG